MLLTSEHKPSITDVGLSPVTLSLIMYMCLGSEHKLSITDVSLSPVTLSLIMCLGYGC